MRVCKLFVLTLPSLLAAPTVIAGPPYATDDPETTEYRHYEAYAFTAGGSGHQGVGGVAGLDLSYGAGPDLQLTTVIPFEYDLPSDGSSVSGLGNVELAAKYRFVHQENYGWDIAIFPRIFLPSGSEAVGDRNASFLLPIWLEKDWNQWSAFGGGGCAWHRGVGAHDYCLVGLAVTRQLTPSVRMGAEVFHQTADTIDGDASTNFSLGLLYDATENFHLLASAGPGLQNLRTNDHVIWYAAVLLTY
jgi:hypothetical protein